MTSKERVMTALNYKKPDRIPRFDGFDGGFRNNCIKELNLPEKTDLKDYFNIDFDIVVASEEPWPSEAKTIFEDSKSNIARDGWGRIMLRHKGAYYYKLLEAAVKERRDLESLEFESPYLDSRYGGFSASKFKNSKRCIFCKVGGAYQRTSKLRGVDNFLIDIASDSSFAKALADKVANHIIEIGKESLRRGNLYDTGIWIYDDMAYNLQPMMSPASFEKIFLPAYKRMVKAFKEVGAAKVCLHSDGNIGPLLDMLIDAGIDAINPVEPKAGLHIPTLKAKYSNRLAYIGGMCNARVLPRGDKKEIEAKTREIIEVAKDGGVVIGAHSIYPDVPVQNYMYYNKVVMEEGIFE